MVYPITVAVCTRNRPNKLVRCVKSILSNTYKSFELIVVDSSSSVATKNAINNIKDGRVKYFFRSDIGVAKSRNYAVRKSLGEIVIFTDDDCIVKTNWIEKILKDFNRYKDVYGIFGAVRPYHSQRHVGIKCVSCTYFKKFRIISKPLKKKISVTGNSMSFKKSIFNKIGFFKEWLGVGSIGCGTEEEEFLFRMMIKGYNFIIDPEIKIYHDHWLMEDKYRSLLRKYFCGIFAAYTYHMVKGEKLALGFIKDSLVELYTPYIKMFSVKYFQDNKITYIAKSFKELLVEFTGLKFYVIGICLGFYFAIHDNLKFSTRENSS